MPLLPQWRCVMAKKPNGNPRLRVVLDTNVLVSSVIAPKGNAASIVSHWRNNDIEVVVSLAILVECYRVLHETRIKRKYRLSDQAVEEVIRELADHSRVVEYTVRPTISKLIDPDDVEIIATALAGKATYIITGDQHLLSIKKFKGITITTPAYFLINLESQV